MNKSQAARPKDNQALTLTSDVHLAVSVLTLFGLGYVRQDLRSLMTVDLGKDDLRGTPPSRH